MVLATSPAALALQAQRTRRRIPRPPAWRHPRQIERSWSRALQILAEQFIEQVKERVIPALPAIESQARLEQGRLDAVRKDAWFDRIAPLMQALRLGVAPRETTVKASAIDIGQKTSAWNDREWQKILRSTIGVGLLAAEPGVREQLQLFVNTNAKLMTRLQEEQIAKVEGLIERGFSQGLRSTEIAKQIDETIAPTKARARFIARDQVSKLNGQLTQLRQEQAGIEKYIWQTSSDSRVRTPHSAMQGKLGRWDRPDLYANRSEPNKWLARSSINAVELHPGQDYQCRCFAEPFVEELAEIVEQESP